MQASYPQTIKELYNLQRFSIKMGLDNITTLCHKIGNPQFKYPVIHIAGTNGKGSTSTIINNILIAHGLTTGLYTSPHLIDFRERIRVNNSLIKKKQVVDFWADIKSFVNQLQATFFDTTTALAFDCFAKLKVDVAVIETGLGGRLDSTNIVKPVAAVITPIAIDHIKQLGGNLKSIAKEKVIIVKRGSTFFSAKQKKPVRDIFKKAALTANSYVVLSEAVKIQKKELESNYSRFDLVDKIRDIKIENLMLNLAGEFQIDNASLAYLVSRWYLENAGINFSEASFRRIINNIKWQGRLQLVSKNPEVILDVSHNYSGFKESTKFISGNSNITQRTLLLGLLDDKEYKQIVRLLSKHFRTIILTEPAHERAIPVSVLSEEFLRHGIKTESEPLIIPAYEKSVNRLKNKHKLYVMGSHFIIGEILKLINKRT